MLLPTPRGPWRGATACLLRGHGSRRSFPARTCRRRRPGTSSAPRSRHVPPCCRSTSRPAGVRSPEASDERRAARGCEEQRTVRRRSCRQRHDKRRASAQCSEERLSYPRRAGASPTARRGRRSIRSCCRSCRGDAHRRRSSRTAVRSVCSASGRGRCGGRRSVGRRGYRVRAGSRRPVRESEPGCRTQRRASRRMRCGGIDRSCDGVDECAESSDHGIGACRSAARIRRRLDVIVALAASTTRGSDCVFCGR